MDNFCQNVWCQINFSVLLIFDNFSKRTATGLTRGQGLPGRGLLGELMFKGQLISKCLFGIFNSPKKRTKLVRLEVP